MLVTVWTDKQTFRLNLILRPSPSLTQNTSSLVSVIFLLKCLLIRCWGNTVKKIVTITYYHICYFISLAMPLAKNPEVGQIDVFNRTSHRKGISWKYSWRYCKCKIENYTYTCIIMRDTIIIWTDLMWADNSQSPKQNNNLEFRKFDEWGSSIYHNRIYWQYL